MLTEKTNKDEITIWFLVASASNFAYSSLETLYLDYQVACFKFNSDLVGAFLNSDRQIQDKSILGSYVSIGKAFSFGHAGQVVDKLKISYDASAAFLFSASQMQELDYMSANSTQSLLLGKSSEKQRCG